ncbi:hypothetical protein NDU88_001511 [Pleurodeles waltl]|uniref:Uncharacterized protein n=1 Tax=Pleurodeles waltl TaxID=8319 RepID=A0AAV7LDD4_PLEWA|nr:hypothetical protein NDU88_001511 [Pleurodeles waltl]
MQRSQSWAAQKDYSDLQPKQLTAGLPPSSYARRHLPFKHLHSPAAWDTCTMRPAALSSPRLPRWFFTPVSVAPTAPVVLCGALLCLAWFLPCPEASSWLLRRLLRRLPRWFPAAPVVLCGALLRLA